MRGGENEQPKEQHACDETRRDVYDDHTVCKTTGETWFVLLHKAAHEAEIFLVRARTAGTLARDNGKTIIALVLQIDTRLEQRNTNRTPMQNNRDQERNTAQQGSMKAVFKIGGRSHRDADRLRVSAAAS